MASGDRVFTVQQTRLDQGTWTGSDGKRQTVGASRDMAAAKLVTASMGMGWIGRGGIRDSPCGKELDRSNHSREELRQAP